METFDRHCTDLDCRSHGQMLRELVAKDDRIAELEALWSFVPATSRTRIEKQFSEQRQRKIEPQ